MCRNILPPARLLCSPDVLPQAFLDNLSRVLRRPSGCAVLNVIAGRQRLLDVAARLGRTFQSVHCAATDPNYIFFLRPSPGALSVREPQPVRLRRIAHLMSLARSCHRLLHACASPQSILIAPHLASHPL